MIAIEIKKIRQKIIDGDLRSAIGVLMSNFDASTTEYAFVSNLSGRLEDALRSYNLGQITFAELELVMNNVRSAIIDFMGRLDNNFAQVIKKSDDRKGRIKEYLDKMFAYLFLAILILTTIIFILAVIFPGDLEEKLLKIISSLTAGAGSSYAYLRLRVMQISIISEN